jgi:hypothetical protein
MHHRHLPQRWNRGTNNSQRPSGALVNMDATFEGLSDLPPSVPSSWIPTHRYYAPPSSESLKNDDRLAVATDKNEELKRRVVILENELGLARAQVEQSKQFARSLHELLAMETNISLYSSGIARGKEKENEDLKRQISRLQRERSVKEIEEIDEKEIENCDLPAMEMDKVTGGMEREAKRRKNTWWCEVCKKQLCTANKTRHCESAGHQKAMAMKMINQSS